MCSHTGVEYQNLHDTDSSTLENPRRAAVCAGVEAGSTPAGGKDAMQDARLMDSLPGGVLVLDRRGQVAAANACAVAWLGTPLIGEAWRDVVAGAFLRELDQGELKTADGRQFSISTAPLGYAPGQVLLLSEVTDTRHLQRTAQREHQRHRCDS